VRPTPLASSMRVLHAKVSQELRAKPDATAKLSSGEWKIPSLAAFCDRMSPSHPHRATARRLQGTAGIIWTIQRRTVRKLHEDSHYNNAQAVFLREHVLALHTAGFSVLVISDDD
jgi:hypothetical protein